MSKINYVCNTSNTSDKHNENEHNKHHNKKQQHISEYTFVISEKSSNENLHIISDFNLEKSKIYQISCQLTIIIADNLQKIACHKLITTACINKEFVGGKNGYKIDSINSDNNIDDYIDDICVSAIIENNKFCINICPLKICCIFACATVKITSFEINYIDTINSINSIN